MAEKILIIGGNRFFGRHLAVDLLNRGYDITLLNRAQTDDRLGDRVQRLKADRKNLTELERALSGSQWKFVFDQVCFDAEDARNLCAILKGKTERIFFTSTQSVYGMGLANAESAFDPKSYKFEKEVKLEQDYGEAKRQAEVTFTQHPEFRPMMFRFPIVLGPDDYTKRLAWHVERVKRELPMFFPNLKARMGFVRSIDAGKTMALLAHTGQEGPINVASPGVISLEEMISEIELACGKKARLSNSEKDAEGASVHSPFGVEDDWSMDVSKLKSLGIELDELSTWLPALITEIAGQR